MHHRPPATDHSWLMAHGSWLALGVGVDWQVRHEADDARLRAWLERDRDWAAYLLGDLESPYRQHAHYYLAASDGVDRAVVLVYAPPEFAALVSMGEAAGVAAALAAIPDLPARATLLSP